MEADLGDLVAAYNLLVAIDPELARRDLAVGGPDRSRVLVTPQEATDTAHSAVEFEAATQVAAAVVEEEARVSPEQPDSNNRNSRRLTETVFNLSRALIGRVQHVVRWVKQNPKQSALGAGVGALGAAKWALANEAWLLRGFADQPAMLNALKVMLDFLKTLPLS